MKYVLMIIALLFLVSCQSDGVSLIPKSEPEACGITNCHGMQLECGSDIPDFCTEEYQVGDFCRQFASCVQNDNGCVVKSSFTYTSCKACVQDCLDSDEDVFACEQECRDQMSEPIGEHLVN